MHANMLLEPRYYSAATYLDPYEDWVVPMARLRPGVSAEQAQAALAGAFHQLERAADPKSRPDDVPTLVVREGAPARIDPMIALRHDSKPSIGQIIVSGTLAVRPDEPGMKVFAGICKTIGREQSSPNR
ncbi:MAG: hypothetical protein ACRD1V_05490 [Vicinamibacterales bacterium]